MASVDALAIFGSILTVLKPDMLFIVRVPNLPIAVNALFGFGHALTIPAFSLANNGTLVSNLNRRLHSERPPVGWLCFDALQERFPKLGPTWLDVHQRGRTFESAVDHALVRTTEQPHCGLG